MPIRSASAKAGDAQAAVVRVRVRRTRGTRPSGRRRIGLLDERAYDVVARHRPVVTAVLAFGAIIPEHEIIARAEFVDLLAASRRHSLGTRFQVRLDQTPAIHEE